MSEAIQAHEALLIGYTRVSTDLQNLDLQLDALADAGSARVYRDTGSGSLKHRPELDACLDYLRAGDTLVVWRLDRLGRGLKHLIELVEQLQQREIGFRSLTEQIDTTTPAGRLQFHLFGALAEFERNAEFGITLVMPRGPLCRDGASGPAVVGRGPWLGSPVDLGVNGRCLLA
jgi:hypothetical protein